MIPRCDCEACVARGLGYVAKTAFWRSSSSGARTFKFPKGEFPRNFGEYFLGFTRDFQVRLQMRDKYFSTLNNDILERIAQRNILELRPKNERKN